MYEKLDVYDENRNKTGRIIERKEGEILSSDEYILAIQCRIINSNNEIYRNYGKLLYNKYL